MHMWVRSDQHHRARQPSTRTKRPVAAPPGPQLYSTVVAKCAYMRACLYKQLLLHSTAVAQSVPARRGPGHGKENYADSYLCDYLCFVLTNAGSFIELTISVQLYCKGARQATLSIKSKEAALLPPVCANTFVHLCTVAA